MDVAYVCARVCVCVCVCVGGGGGVVCIKWTVWSTLFIFI